MRCRDFEHRYTELWESGQMPEDLASHLRGCSECRRYQALEGALKLGTEFARQDSPPEPSGAFWPRLNARIESESGVLGIEEIWEGIGRKIIWATGMASMVLALGLVLPNGSQPEVDQVQLEAEAHLYETFAYEYEYEGNFILEPALAEGEEIVGFRMSPATLEGDLP